MSKDWIEQIICNLEEDARADLLSKSRQILEDVTHVNFLEKLIQALEEDASVDVLEQIICALETETRFLEDNIRIWKRVIVHLQKQKHRITKQKGKIERK